MAGGRIVGFGEEDWIRTCDHMCVAGLVWARLAPLRPCLLLLRFLLHSTDCLHDIAEGLEGVQQQTRRNVDGNAHRLRRCAGDLVLENARDR